MSETIAILTRGLRKSYGRIEALRGVDLEVRRGEIFGFLGPNGAGKTTTIRCLLDLIRPNEGELRVLGIDPQSDPVGVRTRVGYLPGELEIYDSLTGEQALRYFNQLRGSVVDWNFVRGLAERIDLDLSRRVKNLSKGNRQKVGVIQALMHQPELLIMDEPTGGLDPLIQQEVLRMLSEAREQGATVFFSSHILSEVQTEAERVGIIRDGEVVEVADTAALTQRAFNRARVVFREAIDVSALEKVPGVTVLSRDAGTTVQLQIEGEMDGLIKALAAYPVRDFETERPSLEEIFLQYYQTGGRRSQK